MPAVDPMAQEAFAVGWLEQWLVVGHVNLVNRRSFWCRVLKIPPHFVVSCD